MARFILRASGASPQDENVEGAVQTSNVKVIDRAPNMMLIESSEEAANELVQRLPGWTVNPEIRYEIPDTRKRIK
jgi:hypothetical protein